MEHPYDDLPVYKVKACQGDGKERVLHRNMLFPLLNAYGSKNTDSQDWNVDTTEGMEDRQSQNSSVIGHNHSNAGGNEHLEWPKCLTEGKRSTKMSFYSQYEYRQSYLAKGAVVVTQKLLWFIK